MEYLDEDQLSLLKKLTAISKINITDLTPEDIKTYQHLEKIGYVCIEQHSTGVNYHGNPRPVELVSVSISERGKSFLASLEIDNTRYKHPYIVSIISLVISALALLLAALSLCLQLCRHLT